jgi:hypothetical protein
VRLTLCNNPAWRVLGNMIFATIWSPYTINPVIILT